MRQIKLKINTTFSENISAGIAAKYLNSEEIVTRDGIEMAISCLYAPIGAAVNGATRDEVEERCKLSRTLLETYINLALTRVKNSCFVPQTINEIDITETTEAILSEELDFEKNTRASSLKSDEELLGINFDDEEF